MKFSIAGAVAVLAGAITAAAPAPDTRTVRLDVIVTDQKDRVIRDLKPADLEISDAGQTRAVDGVSLESSAGGRLVAIFLDEYHVQAGENTDRVRAALARFVDTDLRPNDQVAMMKPLDPLNSLRLLSVASDRDKLQDEIEDFTGRKGNYMPTGPFERNFISRVAGPADASRAQIVSSALQSLAIQIGAAREGRKSLVLMSEGFSPSLPRGSDRLMGSLRAIVYAANRYQVAIYPIDPQLATDTQANDSKMDATTLHSLAEQTGGEATINTQDLMPSLKQAASDLDDYYVVTYQAATAGDGRFHPVQLRVKRSDAQVRIRSGYWSADAELLKPTPTPGSMTSNIFVRPTHASTLIRPWIGTARGEGGVTDVTVVWEPGLLAARSARVGSVTLKAMTDDGQVLFDGPLVSGATFSAAPGMVRLEMTIRAIDGKTLDTDYRGIQVPNLRVPRLTFASLEVMRTRSAREFAEVSADPSAVPAASRDFSRAERLLLRVPVYAPGGATPTVTATLLNSIGARMRPLNRVTSGLSPEIVQFDLPLSWLAPDDYRVELTANAGAEQAKTVLLFRVSN